MMFYEKEDEQRPGGKMCGSFCLFGNKYVDNNKLVLLSVLLVFSFYFLKPLGIMWAELSWIEIKIQG